MWRIRYESEFTWIGGSKFRKNKKDTVPRALGKQTVIQEFSLHIFLQDLFNKLDTDPHKLGASSIQKKEETDRSMQGEPYILCELDIGTYSVSLQDIPRAYSV
jgi:hypothetical protein